MSTIEWRGISIEITHTPQRFGGPFDHIELRAAEKLPVSETGYRSHFIHPDELTLFKGPEDFVRQWLETAVTPEWEAEYQQPSLF